MKYISREEWGAIDTGKPLVAFRRRMKGIVFHHTTGSPKDPYKQIQGHDRYHVEGRGWRTIAYNWLISEDGQIFEGRGWTVGGATKGHNHNTIAISYIGDGDAITDKAKEAILVVVEATRKKYGEHLYIKCHRDFKATYCPSDNLAAWVKGGMGVDEGNPSEIDWDAITKYVLAIGDSLAKKPLRMRSKGKYVTMLQERLNTRLRLNLSVDGVFGRNTRNAVKKFQKNFAIKQDGVVGKVTWKHLWTT
jgi:hypothetical protein